MLMSYVINRTSDNGVISTYTGNINDEIYLSSIKERWHNLEFNEKCRYAIADYSGANKLDISTPALQQSAALHIRVSKVNSNLIFISILPDDLVFGLGRIWHAYANDTGWKIFLARSKDEARQILKENLLAEPVI